MDPELEESGESEDLEDLEELEESEVEKEMDKEMIDEEMTLE